MRRPACCYGKCQMTAFNVVRFRVKPVPAAHSGAGEAAERQPRRQPCTLKQHVRSVVATAPSPPLRGPRLATRPTAAAAHRTSSSRRTRHAHDRAVRSPKALLRKHRRDINFDCHVGPRQLADHQECRSRNRSVPEGFPTTFQGVLEEAHIRRVGHDAHNIGSARFPQLAEYSSTRDEIAVGLCIADRDIRH